MNLGNATLNLSLGFTPVQGTSFTIVDNDGDDPITETFGGLPQNARFARGGTICQINYQGGTGNQGQGKLEAG